MRDLEITQTDTWTPPLFRNKGDSVSISIKGVFTGTIKVRRWLAEYKDTLVDNPIEAAKHIGIVNSYTIPVELVDISAGTYFYQIGTDEAWTGTAYVHLQ